MIPIIFEFDRLAILHMHHAVEFVGLFSKDAAADSVFQVVEVAFVQVYQPVAAI
jgi:hypothetical protein